MLSKQNAFGPNNVQASLEFSMLMRTGLWGRSPTGARGSSAITSACKILRVPYV